MQMHGEGFGCLFFQVVCATTGCCVVVVTSNQVHAADESDSQLDIAVRCVAAGTPNLVPLALLQFVNTFQKTLPFDIN
jgi:hypothetical protein